MSAALSSRAKHDRDGFLAESPSKAIGLRFAVVKAVVLAHELVHLYTRTLGCEKGGTLRQAPPVVCTRCR
jgi:hypothetical protein